VNPKESWAYVGRRIQKGNKLLMPLRGYINSRRTNGSTIRTMTNPKGPSRHWLMQKAGIKGMGSFLAISRSASFFVRTGVAMNTSRYTFAILIFIALTTGCSNEHPKSKPFLVGVYECVAYDQNGTAVVKGTFSIDALANDRFNGHWRLAKSSDARQEGVTYIDGTGNLVGRVDGKEMEIDFNPTMSDANWIVDASIEDERLVGILRWSGFAGGPTVGRFDATRVSGP